MNGPCYFIDPKTSLDMSIYNGRVDYMYYQKKMNGTDRRLNVLPKKMNGTDRETFCVYAALVC